eukprot:scaffold9714_cov49-Attheya_sp.AAC.1
MLNFAEQTGSGAVIFVWSFLIFCDTSLYINSYTTFSFQTKQEHGQQLLMQTCENSDGWLVRFGSASLVHQQLLLVFQRRSDASMGHNIYKILKHVILGNAMKPNTWKSYVRRT